MCTLEDACLFGSATLLRSRIPKEAVTYGASWPWFKAVVLFKEGLSGVSLLGQQSETVLQAVVS